MQETIFLFKMIISIFTMEDIKNLLEMIIGGYTIYELIKPQKKEKIKSTKPKGGCDLTRGRF